MRMFRSTAFISLLACGCGLFVGSKPRYADNVDVAAAKAAFGCDAPANDKSKRACEAIAAFETADKVTSYPDQGEKVYLSRRDCSDEAKNIDMETVALLPGTPPGGVEEMFRPPGSMTAVVTSSIMGTKDDAIANAVIESLKSGKPTPQLSPEQISILWPGEWKKWREKLAKRGFKPVPTAQSQGKSLLEGPSELFESSAYWRESDGALVRLEPPGGFDRWCVNRYFPLPD